MNWLKRHSAIIIMFSLDLDIGKVLSLNSNFRYKQAFCAVFLDWVFDSYSPVWSSLEQLSPGIPVGESLKKYLKYFSDVVQL
jgi:hypothetical protein